jgi:hypothetical protein
MRELKILCLAGVLMLALAACAKTPDTGDFMRQHATDEQALVDLQKRLANDWARGSKLVVSGEKRVKSGRAELERGQQEIAVVCVKLCKKVVMVSAADQAAIFKSSFFCSVSRLMLR